MAGLDKVNFFNLILDAHYILLFTSDHRGLTNISLAFLLVSTVRDILQIPCFVTKFIFLNMEVSSIKKK